MKITHLKVLLAVIEAGGISAASRLLARTQSRISSTIGELESDLGFALLERSSAGSLPTAACEQLLPRVREMLVRLDGWRHCQRVKPVASRPGYCSLPDQAIRDRRLEIFIGVVRTGSMTQVANQIRISQPAVSASIAAMERCTTRALFTRAPGALVPHTHALELAAIAQRVLDERAAIEEEAARTTRGLSHHVAAPPARGNARYLASLR